MTNKEYVEYLIARSGKSGRYEYKNGGWNVSIDGKLIDRYETDDSTFKSLVDWMYMEKTLKVIRPTVVTVTTDFRLGDTLKFALNDGESVSFTAVQETDTGWLFLADDCLDDPYPMNEDDDACLYFQSDLRAYLNEKVIGLFPSFIKERMIPMNYGDLLRIPTLNEIFPNEYRLAHKDWFDNFESDNSKTFYGMNNRKNRIASRNNNYELYWLQNRRKDSAALFAYVSSNGYSAFTYASTSNGLRPVFQLSK